MIDEGFSGQHTVDVQLGVSNNLLDLAVRLEISKGFPCERTVDFQTIDEGSNGDEAVRLDILLKLVVGLLVEDHGVVGLVLNCMAVSGGSRSSTSVNAREVRWRENSWKLLSNVPAIV